MASVKRSDTCYPFYLNALYLHQPAYHRRHRRSSRTIFVCSSRASQGVSYQDQMDRKRVISSHSETSTLYVELVPVVPSVNPATNN